MKLSTRIVSTLFLGLLSFSCSNFIKTLEKEDKAVRVDNKTYSILFSNSVSGETHPCGCKNFPLGGLPQVAGLFSQIEKEKRYIYVDTGDTFFPSSVVPFTMKDSLSYQAKSLANGMDQLGLMLLTPGDQDFALGTDFVNEINRDRKFKYLVTNTKDHSTLNHIKIFKQNIEKAELYFIGLIDPEVIRGNFSEELVNPLNHIKDYRKLLSDNGFRKNNKHHRLIVLSHAGIEFDKELAKKFPEIDWIIGSHSQSFLQKAEYVGKTRLVQGLSKNHYIGEIELGINSDKETDLYKLHPIHEDLEKELIPNPLSSLIYNKKIEMSHIQLKEQENMGMKEFLRESHGKVKAYSNAKDCMTCHKAQGDFWQETPHSIAFTTLLNVNEANNLSCIGCHSLGLNDPKGYETSLQITNISKKNYNKYWQEAKKIGAHVESVRALPKNEIKDISVQWFSLDKKMNVSKNFANVQCLNCHTQTDSHPMGNQVTISKDQKIFNIKNQCLNCHTPDQSPEWFENGLKVNANFQKAYEKVSCPSIR